MGTRRSPTTGPSTRKLDDARGGDAAGSPETFFVGTDQLPSAMSHGLIHASLRPRDATVTDRQLGRKRQAKIRTEVELVVPDSPALGPQDAVILEMQKEVLRLKAHGAGLLKLFLDLMDRTYASSGDREQPEFRYRLSDALARQGYKRRPSRGFHASTMQGMRDRLAALCRHLVTVWEVRDDVLGETLVARTPFFIVEEYYERRSAPQDPDARSGRARGRGAGEYLAVRIRPGRWWGYARMGERRIAVPRTVLQLPTDGRGRERERIALLIATYLAMHVRRNQRASAGGQVPLKVGTLLERAGVITWDEFHRAPAYQATRVREYLHHGSIEEGALPILRRLGAFDVAIRDMTTFFAVGHGWRPEFWDAVLDVEIPDLKIRKPALG